MVCLLVGCIHHCCVLRKNIIIIIIIVIYLLRRSSKTLFIMFSDISEKYGGSRSFYATVISLFSGINLMLYQNILNIRFYGHWKCCWVLWQCHFNLCKHNNNNNNNYYYYYYYYVINNKWNIKFKPIISLVYIILPYNKDNVDWNNDNADSFWHVVHICCCHSVCDSAA